MIAPFDIAPFVAGAARPATVADGIAARLREAISDGRLAPGAALRQDDLARRFGFSRMPIRDALRLLEREGLVTIHPTRGASVAALDADEVRETYAIRELLEVEALRLSCPRLEAGHLAEAERLVDRMEIEPRVADWGPLNRDFHLALEGACGNVRLLDLIARQHRVADRYVGVLLAGLDHHAASQDEHRGLLDAVRRGDVERAVDGLRAHLRGGAARLASAIAIGPRARSDAALEI